MQPRSSADILATAKVKYKPKKLTESTYRGQIVSFSAPNLSTANNSESRSSVTATEPNDNHPGLEHEYAQEFIFRFEPSLEQIYLADAMQQDSSNGSEEHISAASNATLACFVLRTHFQNIYIFFSSLSSIFKSIEIDDPPPAGIS
jgi:hypothetical protein